MFDSINKIYEKYHKIINAVIILIVFVLCVHMFNDMIDRKMTSDFADHIDEALNKESYSLMGFLMLFCYNITKSVHSIGYFTAFLVILTIFVTAWFIREILKMIDVEIDYYKLLPVSIASLFICKLCIPDWSPFYYWNSFSTQPWHSSTFILMRLCAMPVLFYYFKIEKNYLNDIKISDLIIFALLTFTLNFAKPSFMIAFAPVMLVILIKDFIATKGKSFKNAFFFGLCILFSCTIMLFQTSNLYPEGGDTTVSISLANALKMFSENRKYFFNIPFDFAFPIFAAVLIWNNRTVFTKFDMSIYKQSWIMLFVSMLEYLFIREVGFRETHGNFRWGQQFFAYQIFILSIIMLIKIGKNKSDQKDELIVAKYTYYLHVVFGVSYFLLICLLHYFYLEI